MPQAILAATRGADAEPVDIAAIASQPHTRAYELPIAAIIRQGVCQVLQSRAAEISPAWEQAGRPDAAGALDELRQVVTAAIPRIADYRTEWDWLAEAMWEVRAAGTARRPSLTPAGWPRRPPSSISPPAKPGQRSAPRLEHA
ncbi:hypothetical protein ACLQ2P_07250 [Actinomadura citrea]|uniref:hypothetical protein n=1 Tax=Actinomadura citrea TaxID=46158 RepID=UPI003CE507D3